MKRATNRMIHKHRAGGFTNSTIIYLVVQCLLLDQKGLCHLGIQPFLVIPSFLEFLLHLQTRFVVKMFYFLKGNAQISIKTK